MSVRVTANFEDTFDVSVLCLWQSQEQWAKLCFERSPQGEAMVVSVVTKGISDDVNGVAIKGNSVCLRLLRTGLAYAFHYSLDGSTMYAGFMVQAPGTVESTSTFEAISLSHQVPADLRQGA